MTRGTKLQVGSVVNVLRASNFKGTLKVPAEVVSLSPDENKFYVRALQQPFDEEGHTMLALQFTGYGSTWK